MLDSPPKNRWYTSSPGHRVNVTTSAAPGQDKLESSMYERANKDHHKAAFIFFHPCRIDFFFGWAKVGIKKIREGPRTWWLFAKKQKAFCSFKILKCEPRA